MARNEPTTPVVVRFYQVAESQQDEMLARLVAKGWERGQRFCILVADKPQGQRLQEQLWVHPAAGPFLPHGLAGDADAARHPVLIATQADDRNQATVVVMDNGQFLEACQRFDMVVHFVSSAQPEQLAASREHFRRYRELGCVMEYWVLGNGGWQRKA